MINPENFAFISFIVFKLLSRIRLYLETEKTTEIVKKLATF